MARFVAFQCPCGCQAQDDTSKFKSYTTFRAEAEKGPGLAAGAVGNGSGMLVMSHGWSW